mgnify:CR=1 FL=1
MENDEEVKSFAREVEKAIKKIPFTYDAEGYAVVFRETLLARIADMREEVEGKGQS